MNKRRVLLVPAVLLILLAAACTSPQPLPAAPTAIPTLISATMPPVAATVPPAAQNVIFPAAAPSAQAGEAIYQAKCANCHGADGQGQVEKARDFSDVDYLRAAAPVDFFQTITGGKDQMPAFRSELSDEERWNVTFFLWSFAVKADELGRGKAVFETHCVACHAADGSAAIPQTPKLTNVEFIASHPATEFYQAVSGGKGIMPAWQDRLSPEERWAAVEYGRAFAYQPMGR